ncbi:hypothetical protein VTO73DRAFT_10833 [Trametes versicolor]
MGDNNANHGSKLRSDELCVSKDSRAHILVAPSGADPKDCVQKPAWGNRRGRGRNGCSGHARRSGRKMDVDRTDTVDSLCVRVEKENVQSLEILIENLRALIVRRTSLGYPLKRLFLSLAVRAGSIRAVLPLTHEAREVLGSVVEHFELITDDSPNGSNAEWSRCKWDERVPPECREAEQLMEYWPKWS